MTRTALRKDPQPDPAPEAAERQRAWPAVAGRWLPRLVASLAVIPPVAMLLEVAGAGRLQHIDYLYLLTRITHRDGTLKPPDLQNYLSNEHILGLPSVLYWINIQLFAGDNRTLGVFVVVVAGLTVLALGMALPRTMPPLVRAGLVVATSALVFSLHGLWNFTRAMSGTAWLTANLIVIVALLLAARGRWWPAWAVALLASLTYGTAFAVWPVLSVLAIVRREAWWKRLLPLAVGGVLVTVWLSYRSSPPQGAAPTTDVGSLLYYFLTVVGKLWTTDNGGMAALAGAVILAGYAILAANPVARERQLWFWWALAGHAFLSCVMIAVSRVDHGEEVGMHTARYTSASVLIAVPALVLLAAVVHRRMTERAYRVSGVVIVAGVLGFALGAPNAEKERAVEVEHQVEAVAIRGGFSDAYRRHPLASELGPRLRALGHYPFTDDFTLGCGGPEFGSTLDLDEMTRLPTAKGNKRPNGAAGAVEWAEPVDPAPFFHGKPVPIFHGWTFDIADPVRCTVIVDGDGKVVGGGVSGVVRTDVALRFAGVAPNSGFAVIGPVDRDSRVVVIHDSGAMRWLPAEAPPGATGPPDLRNREE